jgi:hypothetical protein
MQSFIASFSQKKSNIGFEIVENLYQQLETISNTTISLQYNTNKFLTFKVYEASKGKLLSQEHENYTLQCQIRGTTYKLTREHLDQLSNRERRELLNHLKIQDK